MHRHVVRAQRPERVLVRPQHAQVEPVRVDVADVAQLAAVDELLERLHAGVVLEQVADHQHPLARSRGGHDLLGLLDRLRERLLDEAVLAGLQHPQRQLARGSARAWPGRPRRASSSASSSSIGGRAARTREGRGAALHALLGLVADPGQLGSGEPVEVAREVRAPVAEADHADALTSQPHEVRGLDAARDAAEVDHERRLLRPAARRPAPGGRSRSRRSRRPRATQLRRPRSGSSGTNSSW